MALFNKEAKQSIPFLIALFFCCANSFAQQLSLQPRFVPLQGSRNYDDIRTVLADSKGFLWFGCNQGLVRFDGNAYQRFEPGNNNKTIASDAIAALYESSDGSIWVGTADKGLYKYNYATDTFTLCKTNTLLQTILSAGKWNDAVAVSDANGVFLFDKTGAAKKIAIPDSLKKNNFLVIKTMQDAKAKNILWMLASTGLYSYDANTAAVKKWHGYGFSTDEVGNMLATLAAANGKIYSATKNKGLVELDIATGKTTEHSFSKNTTAAYSSNNIDALFAYDENNLFAATQDSGVAVFNTAANSFSFLRQHNFSETNFYRFEAKAFSASTGNVAMATQHNGIWVFNKASQLFHVTILPSQYNKVPGTLYTRSIYASPQGKVYAGSYFGDGLYVFDDGAVKSFPFITGNKTDETLIINAIFRDHNNVVWLASHKNGILIFDEAKQTITPAANTYASLKNIAAQKIYCFHEDKQHNLYIATGDAGLIKLGAARQQLKNYLHSSTDSTSILTNNLFAEKIFEDGKGRLWLSTREGVTVLEPSSQTFYHFTSREGKYNSVPQSFWYSFEQDDKGFMYIGTSDGIYKIKADDKTLAGATHFTEKEGLQHNTVYSFVKDRQGMLWVTCRNGLSCYNPPANSFTNFNYKNGLPEKTLMAPMQPAANGDIYHGAVEKYFSFNPVALLKQQSAPEVLLTNFKVFDKDSINSLSLNNSSRLSLAYNQNNISFSFVSPSIFYPDGTRYAYVLEGFDKEWKNAGSRNYASYTNLAPGNYIFKVKSAGANGVWGNKIKSIEVYIAPPFWQTWWFRSLALLLAAAIAYILIKRREKAVEKREAEKTEMEKLRAISYQYQLETEQVINYFASSIYEQDSIDEMLWDVAKNCISKLGFEDCVIYMVDAQRKVLVQKAAWGPKTTDENKIINPIEIPVGKGIVGAVATSGKTEIINDTTADERYIVDDASRLSEITVPIMKDKKVIGIIDSEHSRKNFYTEKHVQILTTVASLLADKIDKMKAEQQTRQKELELLKLNKDLATWQVTAMRAQMNPHFIFNAMNSIQQFTLKNDTDNANLYISKFSTLLRKVLHTSEQNNITLEEEMEQLQLYLDIEKLRMGDDFVYSITADEEIETDALQMPGMLVQPFVENAVKHGLALKEGEKRLAIHFFMPDEHHLHVMVTDNGIGRQRSAELKAQQKLMPHVSKGIQLVQERLQLLEQNKDHSSAIFINDLPNHAGTQVTVVIPIS